MIVGMIAMGLAGMVWCAFVLRCTGLIGLTLITLLVATCFGYEFLVVRMPGIPFTLDRACTAALFAATAAGFFFRSDTPKPIHKGDIAFGGLLIMLLISTLTHDYRYRENQPLSNMLFLYLQPSVLYIAARQAKMTGSRMTLVFASIALFSVYLGATAVAETREIWSVVFPRYIHTSPFTEWLGRARGPFLNPVMNGMCLSLGIGCILMLWVNRGQIGRTLLAGMIAIATLGVLLTMTRSCWMGCILLVGIIIVVAVPPALRIPLGLSATLLLGTAVMFKGENLIAFKRDKHADAYYAGTSIQLRPILAAVAWKMFKDRPLLGVGYGQYKKHDRQYLRDPQSTLPLEVGRAYVQHNFLFALLTETGLIGLSIFLMTIVLWAWHGWKVWTNSQFDLRLRQVGLLFLGYLAAVFMNGLFHDVNIMPTANMWLFTMAGVVQGLYARSLASPCRPSSSLM